MNTTKLFFAAAFASFATFTAVPAFAGTGEATYDYPAAYSSTVSRADVHAQAVHARNAGLVAQGELSVVIADTGPALTRAQVRAETLEAIRIGAINRGGEHHVVPTVAQLESIRLAGLKAVEITMASL